jgi:hypothetical protein
MVQAGVKIKICLLAAALLFVRCIDKRMNIIPTPQQWQWGKGVFHLQENTPCVCSVLNSAEVELFSELAFSRTNHHVNPLLLSHWPDHPQGCFIVRLDSTDGAADWLAKRGLSLAADKRNEGYLLLVEPETMVLAAYTRTGLFYAMQSLRFLWQKQGVPAVRISDWPALAWRGVSDDISRGQISTLDHFKRIIETLASYKINRYLLYLEDVYRFKAFPTLGLQGGGLSGSECLELQSFAERNHIEMIPVFQTLGHFENILAQPEFSHLADYPGAASLDVTNPQTIAFLSDCIGDLAGTFQSPFFHIGGDESFDVGRGASRQRVEERGAARVHADHYNCVIDGLRPFGKTPLMYGDMILRYPEILPALPRDVIIVDWDYDAKTEFPSVDLFARDRRPFLVSPGISNWRRLYPDYRSALKNIEQFTIQGREKGALGVIVSNWNDFGAIDLRENNTYGYAFAAECAWKPESKNRGYFNSRFFNDYYGCSSQALHKVSAEMAEMSRQVSWMQWISQPFYPVDGKRHKEIKRGGKLAERSADVDKLLAQVKKEVKRHQDHLDILQWCNSCFGWYGRLAKIQSDMLAKKSATTLAEHLRTSGRELQALRRQYESLWLRYNRPDNLNLLTDLLQRQMIYLNIKAEELDKGDYSFNGKILSPFITCVDSVAPGRIVELQRRVGLKKLPHKALLQIIADSYAEVQVNGHVVGKVMARRSASAFVQARRVQVWDIGPFIVAGDNTIRVTVRNYVQGARACANIWVELDDSVIHSGDGLWQARSDRSGWSPAVPAANTWMISRPMLGRGITSRIEFFK